MLQSSVSQIVLSKDYILEDGNRCVKKALFSS